MDEKRFVIALFGLAVALVVGFIGYRFVAPLTVAVFLYYSTRRLFHRLDRFRLPAPVRAMVSLSLIGIPLIGLLGYAVLLVLIEARRFIGRYPVAETIGAENSWVGDLAELSNPTVDGLVAAYRSGQLDPLIEFVSEQAPLLASTLSGLVLNLLIVVVVTYYLLLDGSKFQAVASPKRILDRRRLEQEMARLDAEAAAYLAALDAADAAEEGAGEGAGGDAGEGAADPAAERARIEAALAALDKRRRRAADKHATVTASGADKTVETEPEATVMGKKAEPKRPAYNVQIVVDPRTSLIVHHAVTDHANDVNLLHAMASATKQDLGLDRMIVIADAGYSDGAEAAACEADGITPCVPPTRGSNSRGDFFDRARFTYDPSSDTYTCPNGRLLRRHHNDAKRSVVQYRAADKDCAACPLKPQCTNAQRRSIRRHLHDPALARMAARVAAYPGLMRLRRSRVEHPFGTIKRRMGGGRFLLKGLQKTGTETALAVTAYNLRRLTSIIGSQTLITKLAG